MTQEQSIEKYKEYLTGHIGNVAKALEVLATLDIPYVTEHIDKLREIVKEHDASKYEEPEWSAYLHHFYPINDEEKMMEEEFDAAVQHHVKNNKHHWNYWCDEENNLKDDIDEEEYKLYTIERICDWLAMAAQHDEGPTEYYDINKEYIVQPDYARELCDDIFSKVPEDFGKDMWKITRGELDEDFLPMNKEVVDSLGSRVKRSKTSNTIEIDTQMTNHDKQLKEMEVEYPKNPKDIIAYEYYNDNGEYVIDLKDGWEDPVGNSYIIEKTKREAYRILKQCTKIINKKLDESDSGIIYGYRTIGRNEFYRLVDYKEVIKGNFDNSSEKQNTSSANGVIAFYKEPYKWFDARHNFFIKCKFNKSDIVDEGIGTYYASKDFGKTKIWTGRRGNSEYNIDEFYVSEYSLDNVVSIKYDNLDLFTDDYKNEYMNMFNSLGITNLTESILNEMKLSQIKQKSKNQDPRRIQKSRNVKTTYLGMSKFGILNFKTTSESRSGYHYQTVEFKDMKPFEDIVKAGKEIMPNDIKTNLLNQDVNVWCTDESFAFWAWAHQAYKNDFLYIDDRIPNLKKAIQAPKVNNVRLNGGACKHILSVIDYVMKPFVLLAISEDMNKYLLGTGEDKMQKQTLAVQNQYDQVAQWDWSEMEEYLGKSRIEIMADISKTLQIIPNTDKGDIITDIVGEALPEEEQGLKRQIVDKLEDLIDSENEQK